MQAASCRRHAKPGTRGRSAARQDALAQDARAPRPSAPSRVVRFVLGRRLSNREAERRKIGALEGMPAMGLDALGSTAYGPEAALAILAPLGAAGLPLLRWAMLPTLVLLAILFASYRQTMRAYPSNGGAYRVARESRHRCEPARGGGADDRLRAQCRRRHSAGVGALVSALPALHPHTLALCLATLALLTFANLRGTLESGRAFALPAYLFVASFVASFAAILALGVYKAASAGGDPAPLVAPPPLPAASDAFGAWLLVRAATSGCTALTGIEAVSNGMGAFRDPPLRHGTRTLAFIVAVLGAFVAGIAWLAPLYRISAMDQDRAGYQTVLSQLAGAVVGHGAFYYVALGALLCVLVLSANTSFVGFPRLCRAVADGGFLPKSFALAGRRLV